MAEKRSFAVIKKIKDCDHEKAKCVVKGTSVKNGIIQDGIEQILKISDIIQQITGMKPSELAVVISAFVKDEDTRHRIQDIANKIGASENFFRYLDGKLATTDNMKDLLTKLDGEEVAPLLEAFLKGKDLARAKAIIETIDNLDDNINNASNPLSFLASIDINQVMPLFNEFVKEKDMRRAKNIFNAVKHSTHVIQNPASIHEMISSVLTLSDRPKQTISIPVNRYYSFNQVIKKIDPSFNVQNNASDVFVVVNLGPDFFFKNKIIQTNVPLISSKEYINSDRGLYLTRKKGKINPNYTQYRDLKAFRPHLVSGSSMQNTFIGGGGPLDDDATFPFASSKGGLLIARIRLSEYINKVLPEAFTANIDDLNKLAARNRQMSFFELSELSTSFYYFDINSSERTDNMIYPDSLKVKITKTVEKDKYNYRSLRFNSYIFNPYHPSVKPKTTEGEHKKFSKNDKGVLTNSY